MDGGTPRRGDRIPLTISFNATCQESGGIFVNETSGEVFFRAPGLTVSEYRKLLGINYGCYFLTVCCRQYYPGRLGVLLFYHTCVKLCLPVKDIFYSSKIVVYRVA